MLSLPPSVRIFVARGATDQRKSFDGLCALAKDVLRQDPFSGHVFVFFGRRRDRVNLLVWDRSGFWVFAKRLAAGSFAAVGGAGATACIEVSSRDLLLLLEGIEIGDWRQRRRYDRPVA